MYNFTEIYTGEVGRGDVIDVYTSMVFPQSFVIHNAGYQGDVVGEWGVVSMIADHGVYADDLVKGNASVLYRGTNLYVVNDNPALDIFGINLYITRKSRINPVEVIIFRLDIPESP